MIRQIEAVYENGLLRPLERLSLPESQRVNITISTPESGHSRRDLKMLERVRREVATMQNVPTLEEIHQMLSVIPGSLTADFIAEREDR